MSMRRAMEFKDILAPLDIELKKVSMLGGSMAIVVVPYENMDMALRAKRETDTAIKYGDYLVMGVFGMGADEASTQFLSIPKGIAVFPKEGSDAQALFFAAVERLNMSKVGSPWVKSLWDSIKETSVPDADSDGEGKLLTGSFYQFYAFMASHPEEMGRIVTTMNPADRHWIEDILPFGMVSAYAQAAVVPEGDLSRFIEGWNYKEKLERKRELGKVTLRKFRTMEHLFTLPSISREIIEMAGDPLVAASKMAKIIEKDPVLTSRLLKVVNSAFYGFRRQIVSVEHAVVILGNDEVVNLAFSIAVHQIMDRIAPKQGILLWEHSLMVAHLAQWLGPLLGCTAANALYTLGLLHDFGKIIFLQRGYTPGELTTMSSLQDLAGEEKETGMSHAEMGAFIAEKWNLPEDIVDGLLSHHLPSKAKDTCMAVTVHLADSIAHTAALSLNEINTAAARFLGPDKMTLLSGEVVSKRHEYVHTRVKALLDM
jgi:putative nucleotidyltransferase with HDIG domain